MNAPVVTVGIISCNRLNYLRATIESARECIQYPNLQWIVVDNASTEPGLIDYLKSLDFIDKLILRKERSPQTEHTTAMNDLVKNAEGEAMFIWPEDVQFITKGDWLIDYIDILQRNKWIGSLCINALRGQTIRKTFGLEKYKFFRMFLYDLKRFGVNYRRQNTIKSSRGMSFLSMGWREEGVIGSGIPSLTRVDTWKELGEWQSPGARKGLVDSSGGGETDMLMRWHRSQMNNHRVIPCLPVAADIINDDIGCKAKVRGDIRYGNYTKPKNGKYYYQLHDEKEYEKLKFINKPKEFERFVKPNGFDLPLDSNGVLIKSSINETYNSPVNV